MGFALAATIHDPDGKLAPAIPPVATALKAQFGIVALNVTDVTHPDVIAAAQRELDASIVTHRSGDYTIAAARRDAVALALKQGGETILHSDFDHIVRWISDRPRELTGILEGQKTIDFLVVGRTPRAFAAGPKRLRETEKLVNHIFCLITGHEWDLMFAVRRMSRRAAETIVAHSQAHDLANDVEWPLLAAAHGLSLGYADADGLVYRTMEDFDAGADTHDDNPLEWIRRVRIADEHAQTMKLFAEKPQAGKT